jgi:metallophosphoesterase (TIGR00282 family)
VRILFIGDIFGKPGRKAARLLLPKLKETHRPDVILANGENLAGGAGITRDSARDLMRMGVAGITTGNHVWDQREALQFLEEDVPIVRPVNYPPGAPGRGCMRLQVGGQTLAVANVQGRVFMRALDDPFRAMDCVLEDIQDTRFILVDVHAEATGEKEALGFYLDGRVSAIVGTHTHVPTADARLLAGGTAYITDVGMTGPRDSIIGMDKDSVIQRYLTQMFHRYEIASGPVDFNAVLIDLNDDGRATSIGLLQETIA